MAGGRCAFLKDRGDFSPRNRRLRSLNYKTGQSRRDFLARAKKSAADPTVAERVGRLDRERGGDVDVIGDQRADRIGQRGIAGERQRLAAAAAPVDL